MMKWNFEHSVGKFFEIYQKCAQTRLCILLPFKFSLEIVVLDNKTMMLQYVGALIWVTGPPPILL